MTTEARRWGIISTGSIARTLGRALSRTKANRLVAVASRTAQAAAAFADEFGVSRAYGSYDDLLSDPEVDVVYIATPHPSHAVWAVRAARAKKHVLCEKPLGMNAAEVRSMISAARANDVFLMEAFMYRCHPQTRELAALIRRGVIGQVRSIHASFGIDGVYAEGSRMITNELGGGGILDLGCYPVSMARLVAGAALGQPFKDPVEVHAAGHVGEPTHVDEYALALLKFPGEIVASLATSVKLWQDNTVRVFGTEGRLLLRDPWHPSGERGTSRIEIERPGEPAQSISVPAPESAYVYEIEAVEAQIARREADEMSLADSLGNALTLDRWRRAIGVSFAADRGVPEI